MADTVVYRPYLSHMGYSHNIDAINLNDGVNSVCSVKESRVFTYSIQNNSASLSSREFDLNVVVLNSEYRNKIIDVLTAPASAITKYGTLEVNGWMLVCQCTGVTEVSNDKGGKYKFKARFYAPDMTWIKKYGTFLTNHPNPTGARFWYNENAEKISENFLELPDGQYGFGLEINSDGANAFTLWVAEQVQEPVASERFEASLVVEHTLGTTQKITSDFLTKTVQTPNGASYMSHIPYYSDLFVKMPYAKYKLSTSTNLGTGNYDKVIVYSLRGMPEWEL